MSSRTIKVFENGKEVYNGPENRHVSNTAIITAPKFFGLGLETWVKVVGFIIAAALFWYRTENFMTSQLKINEYLVTFTSNSDSYNSARYGQVFKQGAPNGFPLPRPQNFSPVSNAHAGENN